MQEDKNCPSCGGNWEGEKVIDTYKAARDATETPLANFSDQELEKLVIECYGHLDARIRLTPIVTVQATGKQFLLCPHCKAQFWFK